MRPAVIKGHNHAMTAPAGREGEVATLLIRAEGTVAGPLLVSAWEADPVEALRLLAGSKLELAIATAIQPPVRLEIGDLPETFDPVYTARRFRRGDVEVVRVEGLYPLEPPLSARFYSERIVVANGFADAYADAMKGIEEFAADAGFRG